MVGSIERRLRLQVKRQRIEGLTRQIIQLQSRSNLFRDHNIGVLFQNLGERRVNFRIDKKILNLIEQRQKLFYNMNRQLSEVEEENIIQQTSQPINIEVSNPPTYEQVQEQMRIEEQQRQQHAQREEDNQQHQ